MLELILVLIIMCTVLAMAAPSLRGFFSSRKIADVAEQILALTHYAKMRGVGFSKIVSVGNAIGVNLHEYIEYLKNDPDTKVIMTYLEGIKDGNNLVRVVRETVKKKPVVALKVGRSGAGARAGWRTGRVRRVACSSP